LKPQSNKIKTPTFTPPTKPKKKRKKKQSLTKKKKLQVQSCSFKIKPTWNSTSETMGIQQTSKINQN
jgi:hypothetical protein